MVSAGEIAVRVSGLKKSYGDVQALRGVDIEIRRGEVFGLLGPNGAGKTTLVEILEGHRKRDDGAVDVLGFDPSADEREFREFIGIVLQEEGLDPVLTVHEAVELYSAAYPRPRDPDECIDLVGLQEKRDARVETLSGGQRRRLDLALGIAGDPELIFLDEPTTGFDPGARRHAWELIAGLRARGKTILLTTHYMDEAQNLADRVAVISSGQIVAEGTPDTLAGRDVGDAVVSFRTPVGVSAAELPLPADAAPSNGRVTFSSQSPTRDLAPLIAWASERDLELEGLTVTRRSLEDVYLELTKEATEP